MSDTREGYTFVVVWTRDGACCRVDPGDEGAIDAAVTQWVDTAKTRDTVLALSTLGGGSYRVLASEITSWLLSTPETRARDNAVNEAVEAEAERESWQDGEG